MASTRRPSEQTTAVVLALAEPAATWRYGYELCQQLALQPGSMYTILTRLSDRGRVATAWEPDTPPGRPARHLCRLTGPGIALATEMAQAAITTSKPAVAELRARWEGA